MLMPKRVKHRRVHRGRRKGTAHRGTTIAYGQFGLQALEAAWIDSRQIEAARRAMTNYIKRGGKVIIRIFPHKPVTAKPAETRMGSGKGAPDHWVAVVKPGRILFELAGVREELAKEAMRRAAHKLPIDCKFVVKDLSAAALAEEIEASAQAFAAATASEVVEETDATEGEPAAVGEEARDAGE